MLFFGGYKWVSVRKRRRGHTHARLSGQTESGKLVDGSQVASAPKMRRKAESAGPAGPTRPARRRLGRAGGRGTLQGRRVTAGGTLLGAGKQRRRGRGHGLGNVTRLGAGRVEAEGGRAVRQEATEAEGVLGVAGGRGLREDAEGTLRAGQLVRVDVVHQIVVLVR